ncbi:unnamed protein product [Periconia digitata]|uniref:Ketosynthase family 3 (KS3) domain-containing protein n=1 Tax=Periconia digitata TaxID=1303443 RepID=A0A9W4ULE5_9PLEO|nr:unnamed protein product [Periconia digitata]
MTQTLMDDECCSVPTLVNSNGGSNGLSNVPNGHGDSSNGHSNGTNGHSNGFKDQENGINGHSNGANGHSNGTHGGRNGMPNLNGQANGNSTHARRPSDTNHQNHQFEPIAVCGMACRLPGGIRSPEDLWEFLVQGRDGRTRVPKSRFNIDGWYSSTKQPGTSNTEYGYFLDESVDLAGLDTSFFSMTRKEVEWLDPQQRLMLEVARESLEDACEVGWEGSNTGVYMGNFTQDWYDMMIRDGLRHSHYAAATTHDFMISERISHEMDLRGPSLTIRTACSSALTGLNEACMAIGRGDCDKAIVGGTSLILAPDMATRLSGQGVLSPDGSCNTFSANANGYSRWQPYPICYFGYCGQF